MKFLTSTLDFRDIINAAEKCLNKIWKDGHRYQKAGIMSGDFLAEAWLNSICLTRTRHAPEVKVDRSAGSSERGSWEGHALLCRTGYPATVADETLYIISEVCNEILRSAQS